MSGQEPRKRGKVKAKNQKATEHTKLTFPTLGQGVKGFSRIVSINPWLQTVSSNAHGLIFIDNFNLFWRPLFISLMGRPLTYTMLNMMCTTVTMHCVKL